MKRIHWCLAGVFLVELLLFGEVCAERCFQASPSITDDGARKIMIANVRKHGSVFLQFPGETLAPTDEYLPGTFHFQRTERGVVSFHAPYFSFLAAYLPLLCCGYVGCGLALLTAFLMTFLLPLKPMRAAVLLDLALSALTFYGPLCWEMPFCAALGGLAVLWLLEAAEKRELWRFALSGAAIGAGLFLREEFYVLGAVSALVLLGNRKTRGKPFLALVLGGLSAASLYWGCNAVLFGHILGVHGAGYFRNGAQAFSLLKYWNNYWVFLFRFDPMPLLCVLLLLLTALGAAKEFKTLRGIRIGLIFAASLLWIAAAIRIWRIGTSLDFLYSISFAGANPLFVFFLGSWGALWHSPQPPIRFATRLCCSYLLIAPLLLNQSDMGIVWGSRHFFVLFVPLACLSVYASKHLLCGKWARSSAVGMVLLASAALLSAGIFQRNALMRASAQLASALERTSGPVVTDLFFLPEMTPAQSLTRPFLSPCSEGDLPRLMRHFEAQNIRECVLVLSPRYRKIPNGDLALFLQKYQDLKPEPICVDRVPVLDCWVIPCRLRP